MSLTLVEPRTIQISGKVPKALMVTQTYYLGYGRNAWNSTWINRYYPNSVSFDVEELKTRAEDRRVQGSEFKIESVPLLVLDYEKTSFGLLPINERGTADYKALMEAIRRYPMPYFWHSLPRSIENWLLVFSLTGVPFERTLPFVPAVLISASNGPKYFLSWLNRTTAEKFLAFHSFVDVLRDLSLNIEPKTFDPNPVDGSLMLRADNPP